jgi:hypothetical protein
MRLTHTHRHRTRIHRKSPRVEISQAEITADLLYPAAPSPPPAATAKPRVARR